MCHELPRVSRRSAELEDEQSLVDRLLGRGIPLFASKGEGVWSELSW